MFRSVPGPSIRHSVPCVLPHVSLLREQRRSRNEPRIPFPTYLSVSEQDRGNLGAVTSELWALAQDSSQPETHKDQSTSEYSCPGPQAEPIGHSLTHTPHCQPRAGVSLTWLRVWPGHPDTSRTRKASPSLCESWALNPPKHLVDVLRDPVFPA